MVGRLIKLILLIVLLSTSALAQSYSLRMKEVDGTPNQPGVRTIVVPNGSLSCSGSVCTLTFSTSSSITIGDTVTGGTAGSVLFVGSGPVLAQDNSNFFWDDTNNRLGIGRTNPSYPLGFADGAGNKIQLGSDGVLGTYGIGITADNRMAIFAPNTRQIALGIGDASALGTALAITGSSVATGVPLSVTAGSTGDKIYLFGTSYGMAVQAFELQLFADGVNSVVNLGYNNTSSFVRTFQANASGVISSGYVLGQERILAKTTTYGVAASDGKTIFTNEGASAQVEFDLPTAPVAPAGYCYTFIAQDSDGIKIVANTGDTIRLASSVSASAGNIQSNAVGDSVKLCSINATEWMATEIVGTWTVN